MEVHHGCTFMFSAIFPGINSGTAVSRTPNSTGALEKGGKNEDGRLLPRKVCFM